MVEARIEVRLESGLCKNNPFYGKIKSVIERNCIYLLDKFEVQDTAPFGVVLELKYSKCEPFKIKANRYAFEGDEDSYSAFFELDGKVYELVLNTDKDNVEVDVELREWFDRNDFEEGDDADMTYTKENFAFLEKYL